MATRAARNWKKLQPASLRDALELCKEFARDKLNRSVERIADEMGLTDRWCVYKWIQSGRIPANLIRPFETACGIDYVTRWIAASAGKLLVDIPTGRRLRGTDVMELHTSFSTALQLLTALYDSKADQAEVLAALTTHLEEVAWHRENIAQFKTPELDFGAA